MVVVEGVETVLFFRCHGKLLINALGIEHTDKVSYETASFLLRSGSVQQNVPAALGSNNVA